MDLRELKATAETDPAVSVDQEIVGRDHIFSVTYSAPGGKQHSAELLSTIMSGDERTTTARLAARQAGVPWAQIPAGHAARIWAVATLAIQLREPPDWVGKWALEDDSLLFSIFDVLTAHDAFFFSGHGGQGEETTKQPRVAVHTSLTAKAAALSD